MTVFEGTSVLFQTKAMKDKKVQEILVTFFCLQIKYIIQYA